jgi:hypothetical protein
MKRKRKLFLCLLIIFIVLIIAIVIFFIWRSKQSADVVETVPVATTQAPETTATPTTQAPETTATPTTEAASAFQGSLTGNWSGQVAYDPPVDIEGTFSVTIDAKGVVEGSFEGSYSGTITGKVDLYGNLSAKGTASEGQSAYETTWKGKLSVSGNTLSTEGDLSGQYMLGKFSGTGASSD